MTATDQAVHLAELGYYVAPVTIRRNPVTGKKMPSYHGKWRDLSTRDPDTIRSWAAQLGPGLSWCIDCAKTGIVVIDLDVKPDNDATLWWAGQSLPFGAVVVDTPSGGMHLYFRAHPTRAVGNSTGGIRDGIDVRGDGGHVYAPGSRVVGDGDTYTARELKPVGELDPLPHVVVQLLDAGGHGGTREAHDWASGAQHDRPWVEKTCAEQLARVAAHPPNLGAGFRHVLMGAAMVIGRAVAAGIVTRHYAEMRLIEAVEQVWGTADPDDYRWIRDGLDDGEADPWTVTEPGDPPVASVEPPPAEPRPDSSWRPIDLADDWEGEDEPEQPTLLARADGVSLIYPGRTHSIYGESESGKSWVALILVAQVLATPDGTVLYIDHESDRGPIKARLRALGVTRDQARRLAYVRPDGPRDAAWLQLLERRYTLAVVDGVSVAIASDGHSSDSTDETVRWLDEVPRRLEARTGAAVLTIDHVTKARDGRGRFAIGSQAKLNAISGAAYTARVHAPFGRGDVGELVLRITKDRPGGIRPHCGPAGEHGTQEAARVVLDATDPRNIKATVKPWSAQGAEETDLPFGDAAESPVSWRDVITPLPAEIVNYEGDGKTAMNDLARFMRHTADGGVGQSMANAKAALKAAGHKPWSVGRAWGGLLDLKWIEPTGTGASASRGYCVWVDQCPK